MSFLLILFFFFSSRRRHTRWTGDWSSDVCSSDSYIVFSTSQNEYAHVFQLVPDGALQNLEKAVAASPHFRLFYGNKRSEERRVGKEGRSRRSPYPRQKKKNEKRRS